MRDDSIITVRDLMMDFADISGLTSIMDLPRRYLWTDAFAVCNFLSLYRMTGDSVYLDLAMRLVHQVHHILGRHRHDDPRSGWISGLSDREGALHPTRGGLRIGKSMGERQPEEAVDENTEWDRDGQYFHYLTKWMHALSCVSRVTGDARFLLWAIELAQAAHHKFIYQPSSGGRKRMYWKMSIDLSRPLVPSMGQHDPLDGLVTYTELRGTATRFFAHAPFPDLSGEIADVTGICQKPSWITDDALGIGGLLCDAWRMAQLTARGDFGEAAMVETALDSALFGMQSFQQTNPLKYQARHRLPFRELGLSIGLEAMGKLQESLEKKPRGNLQQRVEGLMQYKTLGEMIARFWLDGKNREAESWTAHREINMVMLATCLAPDEFLTV